MKEQPDLEEAFVSHPRTAELLARAQAGEDVSSSVPETYQMKFAELLAERQKPKEPVIETKGDVPESSVVEATEDQKRLDQGKIKEVRTELGLDVATGGEQSETKKAVSEMVEKFTKGRIQAVKDLYASFLADIDNPESRRKLASALFQDSYNEKRKADYPIDPHEEATWEKYLHSENIPVNNKKKEWMYRGVFTKSGEETQTRGSFNVDVKPELIDALDALILSGKIKANYKFGQPGTSASPTDRHDSISMYFLEEPSEEALDQLATLVKPYARGDNLLGKKVGDGFFMSEVGSVESAHIDAFVDALKSKDPAFADAVRMYTAPQPGRGTALKLSEAQFYAVKDVAKVFGYDISYTKDNGFEIKDEALATMK